MLCIMSFSYVLTGRAVLHSPQVDKQSICSRSSTPAVSVGFFWLYFFFSPSDNDSSHSDLHSNFQCCNYNQGVQEQVFVKVLIWRRQTVPTHKSLKKLQHTAGKSWCVHSQNTTSLSYIPYNTWQRGCLCLLARHPCCPPLQEPELFANILLRNGEVQMIFPPWHQPGALVTSPGSRYSSALPKLNIALLELHSPGKEQHLQISCKSPHSGGLSWGSEGLCFEGHPEKPRQPPA